VGVCLMGMAARTIPSTWIPATTERWRAVIEVVGLGSPFGLLSAALLWYALFTRVERQYLTLRLLPGRKPRPALDS